MAVSIMLWSCDLFTLLYGFDTGGAGAHVKQRQTNEGNIMETAQWRCTAEWCITSLWNKGERHKRMHICSYTGRVSQARLRLIRAVYVHERLRDISDILWCDVSFVFLTLKAAVLRCIVYRDVSWKCCDIMLKWNSRHNATQAVFVNVYESNLV